jgi:hypothetical protein
MINRLSTILRMKWVTLITAFFIWLAFTISYASFFIGAVPAGSTFLMEQTKFVALSISAFGVLFSALLTSYNSIEATLNTLNSLGLQRQLQDEANARAITENSFKVMERWDSPSLREARDVTRAIQRVEDQLTQKQLLDKIATETATERSVITMFNYFEEIYLSITHNRVNEAVLRTTLGAPYVSLYTRFQPWIVKHVSAQHQVNLQELFRRWN